MPVEHPNFAQPGLAQQYQNHFSALNGMRQYGALASCNGTKDLRELTKDIRGLTPLPADIEKQIDGEINVSGQIGLNLVRALINAGLVTPLPNWLGVLYLETAAINNAGVAKQTMEFDVRYERAMQDISTSLIPIYGTWEAFDFGTRLLAVAQSGNWPLQNNMVVQSLYNVNYAIEKQALRGLLNPDNTAALKINGHTAPGILSSGAEVVAYKDSEAWTAAGHSGEDVKDDINSLAQNLIDRNFPGPFGLIVGTTYDNKLNDDYKAGGSGSGATTTIRQRILENNYGGSPLTIIPVPLLDQVDKDYTIMFQMTKTVIDVIVGQGPQQFNWRLGNGPFDAVASMIIACMITRIHSNYDGDTGIVIGYPTAS